MGVLSWIAANPGLLVFTVISIVIVAYLLYAMLVPTRF